MTTTSRITGGFLLVIALLVSFAAPAAEFAPDYDYISEQMMPFFEGKSPEEIAPYLAHHNSNPYNAAVRSLAAHGDAALPLVEKLLGDTHPWIRAGAVKTLGVMFRDPEEKRREPREVTPELKRAVALAGTMLDDAHPAVQQALGAFVQSVRAETPETQQMALYMAASTDPAVRGQANNMARHLFKDPATVIRIGKVVGAAKDGNTPGHWNIAYMMVKKHKENPIVREVFPSYAAFLCHKANSRPYRGFFSDGAQNHMMEVLQLHWDAEVEATPELVAGLCRSYVRVPYHPYPGWIKTRDLAMDLLSRCSAESVPAILATCREERKWFEEVDDVIFKTTTEHRTPIEEAKAQGLGYVAELETLAEELERKKAGNEEP